MSGTANTIVNTIADRIGEVGEYLSPTVEAVKTVAQTVVQETANTGMAYVGLGVAIMSLSIVAMFFAKHVVPKWIENEDTAQGTSIFLIVMACVAIIIGLVIVGDSMSEWIAPTKTVMNEVLEKLSGK